MVRKVTIAAGQVGPLPEGGKEKVVEKLVDMVNEAADKGVEILSFTELCLTPFFPPSLDADYEKYFDVFPSPLTEDLFRCAKERGMVLILPYGEKEGVNYYNAAMVIDADGTILGNYRKVHIPSVFPSKLKGGTGTYEKLYFKPGNLGFPVFNTAKGKVGVQICYDRKFPEGSRCLGLAGAEIVFIPTCAATYGEKKERVDTWGLPERSRAFENGFYVVVPNKAGREGIRENMGRSLIISPYGETLAEGSMDNWEIVQATIDLDEVDKARKSLPFWRDRRPSEYKTLVDP
ncbi:MAG: hypothetical protein KAV87_22825 [Desulfobacteraceae bacterium]|nr:hypothetical protein [Desulfobacteraceae bacterium]